MTGRPRPHRLRRGAVVDRAARDATLDEHDLLLRRAFDVERGGDGSRIHRVIEEREILAGDALADAAGHERAALSHGLPTETGEREDAKYFGDRELFEHGLVIARRQLGAISVERALLHGARRDRRRMEGVGAHRELLRVPRPDVPIAQDERAEVGHRRGRVRRDAARVRDRVLGHLDLRRARGAHVLRDSGAHGADPLSLSLRRSRGGLLVERRGLGDGLGVRDAGPLLVGTAGAREGCGVGERAAQVRHGERVRRDDADRFADDRTHRRVRFVRDRVLVYRTVRIPRNRRAPAMDVDIRLVGRRVAERRTGRGEQAVRAEDDQSRTSIGTSRKRACAAP